jgi:UDP-N-acetylglucosamine 2-epimerase (hydrolysing)
LSHKKNIVFLTGTRADFGKLKSLMSILQNHEAFEPHIFVTGMHMLERYGYTLIEVQKTGFKNIHTYKNHTHETTMDLTLAKTIEGFSAYINELQPDLIVIHGDRVELIRHATSKMSHIHFVANDLAKNRLIQMGELPASIYTIGSPDIDIMFSNTLPDISEVKTYYNIPYDDYAVAMFHPVTTEIETIEAYAKNFVTALIKSEKNYVVIYPNNDLGSEKILEAYKQFEGNTKFKIFPSLRFEYFLSLLKQAKFIIGNSSAGIREAPCYGVSSINIGTRQHNRASHSAINNVGYNSNDILESIRDLKTVKIQDQSFYGNGDSSNEFLKSLSLESFWKINHQKQFKDIS